MNESGKAPGASRTPSRKGGSFTMINNGRILYHEYLQLKGKWQYCLLFFMAALEIYAVFLYGIHKDINVDEIEHIHSAWYIVQGYVPYKDFFQHHNPLFWYIIAPAITILGDNVGLLLYYRMIMAGMLICTALVSSVIAVRITARSEAGFFCFILMLSSLIFIEKAVEIRPDVPMILSEAVSVYFLIRFLDTEKSRDIVLCGLSASLAFLFLQKAAFFYAVLCLIMIILLVKKEVKIRPAVCFFSGLTAGPALCMVYAVLNGALLDYYLCGYLVNVFKSETFGPWEILKENLIVNIGFWVVAVTGLISGLGGFRDNRRLGIVSLIALALCLSLYFVKRPWNHNFLPAIVFLSITGAGILVRISGKVKTGILLCSFMLAVVVYKPLEFALSYNKISHNWMKMKQIEWVIRNTGRDDLVYDGKSRFNLFRRDLHYFWFSAAQGYLLEVYNRLHENKYGDYNICNLIRQKKPRVVSDYQIDTRECDAFRMYSRVDDVGLFILNDKP